MQLPYSAIAVTALIILAILVVFLLLVRRMYLKGKEEFLATGHYPKMYFSLLAFLFVLPVFVVIIVLFRETFAKMGDLTPLIMTSILVIPNIIVRTLLEKRFKGKVQNESEAKPQSKKIRIILIVMLAAYVIYQIVHYILK